jgi:hypothetical protein
MIHLSMNKKISKQKNQTNKIIEVLGWIGVVMGLGAYTLVVFRVVEASNYWYLLLNVVGSAFLVIECIKKTDWQSAVTNGVVGGFALINFILLFFKI